MTRAITRPLRVLCVALLGVLMLTGSYTETQDDAEYHRQRQAYAEDNFEAVMGNNDWSRVQGQRRAPKTSNSATLTPAQASPAYDPGHASPAAGGPEVVVPLPRYETVRDQVLALNLADEQPEVPLVVLGASSYSGRAIDGALSLRLELGITLGVEGLWKTVPLVGEEVVVVSAHDKASGAELPLSRLNGYHVWLTPDEGEVTVVLELLVPSHGRRGSLEYDFLVAKTPVTRFDCSFPTAGLEPRLHAAVRSELTPQAGGVQLSASLEPTSRIHLVGFKDVGDDQGRQARVYAESLNLLSVDEGGLDLFTVLRFDILYAGTQHFDVLIPEGMAVVSADGQGAFRYTTEPAEGGTLLRGETAFPIRDEYEISLRLRRELPRDGAAFDLELPACQGVEREYGWLGVEVVGNLRLEEAERRGMLAVDMRQLPWEMVQSAVSPILRAYRYHTADAGVRLEAQRLPEQEPATGSVDLVQATTAVSREGAVLTDLRITLRNRLRHSLALRLPAGMTVLSANLDGEPVKPGVAEDGTLFFPLERSAGGQAAVAFTLQVILESDLGGLGLVGHPRFALPAVGLPASTVLWEVYLPANNEYTALEGDLEPQIYAGSGRWFQGGVADQGQVGTNQVLLSSEPTQSAGTGAMPVRIDLPTEGKPFSTTRYWLEADTPLELSCWHMRSWLRLPATLLLTLLLAGATLLLALRSRGPRGPWPRRVVAVVAIGLLGWTAGAMSGAGAVVWGLILGGAVAAWWRGLHRRLWSQLRGIVARKRQPAGPDEEDDTPTPEPTPWSASSPLGQLGLLAGAGLVVLLAAITLLRVLVVVT